jgi:serine/threonine protein kinase
LTEITEEVGMDIIEYNTMEKLLEEQTKHAKNDNDKIINDKLNEVTQSKIDKIFGVRQLKISDYEETDESRKGGRVTKWVNIRNQGEEFAFKIISEEERLNVQNQITILKKLHDWQNITRIYGLTCEGMKWYLVSEWAEYGNLREYYTIFKGRLNLRLKLRMSLDIAHGLNYLRAIEVIIIQYNVIFFNLNGTFCLILEKFLDCTP